MKALRRTLLSWLFYVAACPVLHGQALNEADPEEQVLRRHAAFLNELSDRRRLNSFFQNEQSVFYGVPIRYVNSFRGNLTFARRDLVTVGRIPIAFTRVYDSSLRTGRDFGPGWHLSLAEYMVRHADGTLTYVDDSASELALVRSADGYAPGRPGPTDIASIDAQGNAIVVTRRDGWSKHFRQLHDRFILTAIRDRHGNTLTIRYDGKQLSRIEAQDGRFVAIERERSGRITRITDDQRRTVAYAYEPRGQLQTVIDLGGNRWKYQYDRLGRLERVIDPRDVPTAVVAYDSADKVKKVAILGAQYEYRYGAGDTFITDNAKRLTRVSHSRDGMATSVTSPNGLISELVLDTHNRVTTLLHNASPSAAFSYDSAGRLDTVTRFEDSGAVQLAYEYDDANRPTRITGTDGTSVVLEYSATGDLLRKKQPDESQEFEYSPQGDLLSLTESGEATFYTHNSYGQIETIKSSRGISRLSYFPDGRLRAIVFADGAVYEYHYNPLGFRERVERNDGSRTTYEYDVTGNLIRSEGHQHGAYGGATGQTFEVNDNNQPEVIRFSDGEVMNVLYDAIGNPETISFGDPEAPALEYLYDVTNRLVAVQDGEAIAGSYTYEDTEPDLRLQMDYRTMRIESGAVRQSASVGDILSMLYTRPYGSLGEAVRFDEPTRAFDLTSEDGIPTPNGVILNSLRRRNLVEVDAGGPQSRTDFDRPSSAMFLPPEYASINCAACVFTGAILKGNGVTGTLSVPVGATVTLAATKTPTSTCPESNIEWTWTVDGVPMPWSPSGNQSHTFSALGSHPVRATGECTPCDVIRIANLTVNVACTATVSISSPTHNPSPSDASWQTNYSFLSSSVIPASVSTSPTGASSLTQWTITPTIGQIQNLVPSNGMGPAVSFQPNVTHPPYTPGAGSFSASSPLSYAIRAAVCSSQDTHTVTQDQRDRVRQEYLNHGISIPSRADFTTVAATAHFSASEISQSAYTLMVGNPGIRGEAVRGQYNQLLRTTLGNPAFPEQGLAMSSGWRNPERNEAVNSLAVASIHQYGNAADLQVLSSTVTASGLTMAQLWGILAAAGDAVGSGFCERGNVQVSCNDPLGVSHVHVQP